MRHEVISKEHVKRVFSPRRESFEANRHQPKGRAGRVLPLAICAIIATVGVTKGVSAMLWDASGHRYAEQVINEALPD